MKELQVIGISHSTKDPQYEETVAFLRNNILAGKRVAFESPYNLSDIPYHASRMQDDTTQFLGHVLILIQQNKAVPLPVEEMRAFDVMHARIKKLRELGKRNIHQCDWMTNYLTQYRSVRHLELAREREADLLITGIRHAYDLDSWGYRSVSYATQGELYQAMIKSVGIWHTKAWAQKQAERARKSF